jgi:DNA-binding CsgD family transcriptional regulator
MTAGRADEARLLLLERTRRLLRCAAVFWTVLDPDQTTSSAPDPSGAVRTDIHGLDDWQRALWEKPFFDGGEYVTNPLWEPLQRQVGRLRTHRRAEVVAEEVWTRHPQNELARALGFDDDVASMVPIGRGRECLLAASTGIGDPRLCERERLLLHLVQGALPWFSATLMEPLRDRGGRLRLTGLEARLAPRLRPVLRQLLTGRTEKEIAAALGLSPRTVHKYVELIFAASEVSGRAELMALFIDPPERQALHRDL